MVGYGGTDGGGTDVRGEVEQGGCVLALQSEQPLARFRACSGRRGQPGARCDRFAPPLSRPAHGRALAGVGVWPRGGLGGARQAPQRGHCTQSPSRPLQRGNYTSGCPSHERFVSEQTSAHHATPCCWPVTGGPRAGAAGGAKAGVLVARRSAVARQSRAHAPLGALRWAPTRTRRDEGGEGGQRSPGAEGVAHSGASRDYLPALPPRWTVQARPCCMPEANSSRLASPLVGHHNDQFSSILTRDWFGLMLRDGVCLCSQSLIGAAPAKAGPRGH